MPKDGKDMQERFQTILREGRILARDAGKRAVSLIWSAYQEACRRLGRTEEKEESEIPTGQGPAEETTPEGYAVGQRWQPKDRSKKSREIVAIQRENEDYYVIWQSPQEKGQHHRIKEASFTRWVRREDARLQ